MSKRKVTQEKFSGEDGDNIADKLEDSLWEAVDLCFQRGASTSLVLKVEGDRAITIDIYEDPRDRDTLHSNITPETEEPVDKKTQH